MPRFRKQNLNLLHQFGRSKSVQRLIAWLIRSVPNLLPIQLLYLSHNLVAFSHPQPLYPFHVLIIPRAKIVNLQALSSADAPLLEECLSAILHIVSQYELSNCGYQVIVNGGEFQQFPQVHFHLISERGSNV